MEEQYKNEDAFSKRIIKEAGMHSPSSDFAKRVMSMVQSKVPVKPYKPLISTSVWGLIGLTAVLVIFFVYIFPLAHISFFGAFDYLEKLTVKFTTNAIQFSRISLYGIAFLGLFIIQIPFLKKYLRTYN